MSIPGHVQFDIAARLYADLFPRRSKNIDGSHKDMQRIFEALDEAAAYYDGEDSEARPDFERWR